jgi:hypothetical protein
MTSPVKFTSAQAYEIVIGDVIYTDDGYARIISKCVVGGVPALPLYELCARPLEGDPARQVLTVLRIEALSRVSRVLWYREQCDLFTAPEVMHLVSCVSMKRSTPSCAEDLYVSPWFKAARRHVSREPWAILSARHGLLRPDQVIEPYDDTLSGRRSIDRRAWAASVLRTIPPARRYVIWAGAAYAEHLAPSLNAELPLRGLGIGEQLAWFNARWREGCPSQ